MNDRSTPANASVLAQLRKLLPHRRLLLNEAFRLAELQANRLRTLRGAQDEPISEEIVAGLPGVAIDYDIDMPASGASDWDSHHRHWVITLRACEPDTRQRFTLLHEYKHIIDHGHPGILIGYRGQTPRRPPAELVADYFAACVLMPKRLVKAEYFGGTTSTSALAATFDVSPAAMRIRLRQLGLNRPADDAAFESRQRHMPSNSSGPGRYQRSLSANQQQQATVGVAA